MTILLASIQDAVTEVLSKDDRIVFAYIHGSIFSEGKGKDVDLAIFSDPKADNYSLPVDLKVSLHRKTDLPPEAFNIRIINDTVAKGDIFTLLYLRNVLEDGCVLVDNSPSVRADFLESYGFKFRECEGLIQEVLA